MKIIVEYMNHINDLNMEVAPNWLVDSGHFFNSVDKTWVGSINSLANRNYFVPDTISILTKEQLITRCIKEEVFVTNLTDGNNMDKELVADHIANWVETINQ